LGYLYCLLETNPKSREISRERPRDGSGPEDGRGCRRRAAQIKVENCPEEQNWRKPLSFSEARSHFEKARINPLDKSMPDLLEGLKHLSHAIEEDFRTMGKKHT
jgi:hypothetical protein